MTAVKISKKEFEAYTNAGGKTLSDMDMAWDFEKKTWSVPGVEWSDWYGDHWSYYVDEDARDAALNEYQDEMDKWVLNYRVEQAKAKAEKLAEKKYYDELNTLGSMFPQLQTLKSV